MLEPYLVETYEWNGDRTILTLRLRSDVTWSDGEPLTAEDVAYTFSLQKSEEVAWISADRKQGIRSWKEAGNHEIAVYFAQPSFFNLLDLNEGVIVPQHHFQRWPVSEWQRDWSADLVVYGPYRPGPSDAAEQFVLERLRPGTAPDLGFTVVRDKETHFQLLRAGQVDYSWTLPVDRIADIQEVLNPVFYQEHSFAFLGWNPIDPGAMPEGKPFEKQALEQLAAQAPHPVFSDVRVRRAMAHAMNRKGYLSRFWDGVTTVPATPWQAGLPYHDSSVGAEAYDPEIAASLLDEAGWQLHDGVRRKDGRALAFTVLSVAGSAIREQYLLAIQQDLASLGVTMEIDLQEASRFFQNCIGGNFDALFGLFQTPSRPDFSSLYHSESQYNFMSWTSVDAALSQVRTAVDGDTLRRGLAALEQAFVRDHPLTPLYTGVKVGAARKGLDVNANYLDPLYGVERWLP